MNFLSFWLTDGSAASGMAALMHGDGGFTNNLGLMPLLARQVKNIMVFVNGKNEIDENIRRVAKLGHDQVILLAHLSYWNLTNPATHDVIRKGLKGVALP